MIRARAQIHVRKARDTTARSERANYHRWLTQFDELSPKDINAIREHMSALALERPLILVRVDCQTEGYTERTISSLTGQLFADWRALICFEPECSVRQFERAQLRASSDPRLTVCWMSPGAVARVMPEHSNTFLLLSGGIVLRQHAVYMLAVAATTSGASIMYSDEDRIATKGERLAPSFKPAFSPELFRQRNYLGNCIFLRTGGVVPRSVISDFLSHHHNVDSLMDDLVPSLGASDVLHVPHILFHVLHERQARPPLPTAVAASDPLPLVSVIIPTKDKVELLRACLDSIRNKTQYPSDRFDITIVDHDSREQESLSFLRNTAAAQAAKLLKYAGGFNFSRINNMAAALSQADVLVFLNNDTVIIDPLWLHRLVSFAMRPDVAAVGGKLLYPDRTVQHGGVVVGVQCSAVHCHVGLSDEDEGVNGLANITREVASTTAACMAVRLEVFKELGGFDEQFATAFNDTDFCLKALRCGYRNIYIGQVLAIHHENKTRGRDDTPDKVATFQREAELVRIRHRTYFKRDPYYNPNLSAERLYDLAFAPRRSKPWREHARRNGRLRVLILSLSQGTNLRLSCVIDLQARHLVGAGHHVYVGGPPQDDAYLTHEGCVRIDVVQPEEVAKVAFENDIDCIVAHDPLSFAVAKWTGPWPKVICCHHAELPRELFRDERDRLEAQNRIAFSLADCVIRDRFNGGTDFTADELEGSAQSLKMAVEELCFSSTAVAEVPPSGTEALEDNILGHVSAAREAEGASGGSACYLEDLDRNAFYAMLGDLKGSELVDRAYLAILGRYADQSGRQYYRDLLAKGVSRGRIVWEIANSDEARSRGVCARDVMVAAGLEHPGDVGKHKMTLANLLKRIWSR